METATARSRSPSAAGARRRRHRAINEPLAFITFVAAYPLGSEVTGEVASFTSHGAMIEVGLPAGGVTPLLHPLAGLGSQHHQGPRGAHPGGTPGVRAGQLDPPRRVAELAFGLGTTSENGATR